MDVKEPSIQLPVRFVRDPSLRTAYATSMMVQATDQEFILTFFEARPPFILGNTPEERRLAATNIDAVEAVEVARVLITPDRVATFVDLLMQNMGRRASTAFPTTNQGGKEGAR